MQKMNSVSIVVEWSEPGDRDPHVSFENLPEPFCCVLGKDIFRHFSLLGDLGK